ncbi:MAG: EpsG family protein [Pseudomonadota bacterium]
MLAYWILFLIPAAGMLMPWRLAPSARLSVLWLIGILCAAVIGLRHEVGGDWYAYLRHFDRVSLLSFSEVLLQSDPGYYWLNWIVARQGGSIHWVNLACGAIVSIGLVTFLRRQPLPWLGFVVVVPYLVLVVAMGYSRQGAALGFALLGLAALGDKRLLGFMVWIILGATFHKTVVVLLPLAGVVLGPRRVLPLFAVVLISLIGGYVFIFDSIKVLWANYVEAEYHSPGGLVRVLMNALPGVAYLAFHRRLVFDETERRLWWWVSVLSIACVPLVLMASTATDRMALYLIPLQIVVFSRLHRVTSDKLFRAIIVVSVVAYYAVVLMVWLLFSKYAQYWLPYQAVIFT